MTDRTERITRISALAGYVVAAAGTVGLASIALNLALGEPFGMVTDLALLIMVGATAPLMLAFYELGGRTPLRLAQLAQTLGWLSVGVFVVVQLQVVAGVFGITPDFDDAGPIVIASLALGYIGLWIAGADLLAGPWLSTVRWLGVIAGMAPVVLAVGTVVDGLDSSLRWLGGVGFLVLGSAWAYLIARLLNARYGSGHGELG